MKKNLITLIILIFLTACTTNKESTNETYALADLADFKEDSSLYTDQRIINYPSSVKQDRPYTKKDLDNLDYDKEVRLNDIYFRIPERCAIFKKDTSYYIDFPLDLSYKVLISFENIKEDLDLIDLSEKIIRENSLNSKLVTRPIRNKFTNLDSAYFITEDGETTSTHFFIKSSNSTIYFIIKEENTNAGGKIMADMIMTAYTAGDDPLEVRKSFKDYKDSLSVYATEDLTMAGLDMKIPENFYLNQEGDGFKYYLAKQENDVIGEIIMKEDKPNGDIYDAFSLNSGDLIYPTQLINMGKVSMDGEILEGEIRLYTKEATLTGKKFLIQRDSTYLTIIVVGPIANKSLSLSMADSIKESIEIITPD